MGTRLDSMYTVLLPQCAVDELPTPTATSNGAKFDRRQNVPFASTKGCPKRPLELTEFSLPLPMRM